MKEYRLNMLSRADMVKGQGVLSAYEEELRLISGRLDRIHGDSGDFKLNISINDKIDGDITHIHTVNPEFFLRLPAIKSKGIAVGSVHFFAGDGGPEPASAECSASGVLQLSDFLL